MGATATLTPTSVKVPPGGEANCSLVVRNTGTIVDQFTFEVLGDAAAWSTVEPASVSLFPDGEETVRVWFRPPRTADLTAGPVAFGVKVTPSQDSQATTVEEGDVLRDAALGPSALLDIMRVIGTRG